MTNTPAAVGAVETAFSIVGYLESAGRCGVTELALDVDLPQEHGLQALADAQESGVCQAG